MFYKATVSHLGPKKYQKIARMYDRTGLSTKCTLIKTSFKNLRTGMEAKFRPFVNALFSLYSLVQGALQHRFDVALLTSNIRQWSILNYLKVFSHRLSLLPFSSLPPKLTFCTIFIITFFYLQSILHQGSMCQKRKSGL